MSNPSTGDRRLPQEAAAVIIGQGGIVGAAVAHHLIEHGWK
ncbi:MAG: FAD-dependent oxidoreductase, partial [Steroidobacteraceae bacterium]